MKKLSMFVAIFIFCMHNAFGGILSEDAEYTTIQKTCPAGFFCTANGKYTVTEGKLGKSTWIEGDIEVYAMGPAELVVPGWGVWSDEQLCDERTSNNASYCAYYATDYDEVWVSTWFGFYMVKNGDITYNSASNAIQGVFPCPGTYPSSEVGASSVFQCYRVVRDGEKEYYTTPNNTTHSYDGRYDTDTINVLLTNLQSAVVQAQTAVNNLQNILQKSNTRIRVFHPAAKNLFTNMSTNTKNASNPEIDDTTEKTSVSISPTSIKTKSSGFDWATLNEANLFSTPVKTKSAVPVKSRTGINTQARTVVNETKRDISDNADNKSRQAITNPKVSRPISGKNISRSVSNKVSRRTE